LCHAFGDVNTKNHRPCIPKKFNAFKKYSNQQQYSNQPIVEFWETASSIISSSISMLIMMLMAEYMTCLVGLPANNQIIAQRHGARLDCGRGPEEYFGLMEVFLA